MSRIANSKSDNPVVYINDPFFYSNFVDDLIKKSNQKKKIRMNGTSLDEVVEAISTNDIVIIYRENCYYSKKARKYLSESGLDYQEIDIDQIDATPMELRERLSSEFEDFNMYRTLPMIFIKGKFKRGADELPGTIQEYKRR
jgi:glutaredoxin